MRIKFTSPNSVLPTGCWWGPLGRWPSLCRGPTGLEACTAATSPLRAPAQGLSSITTVCSSALAQRSRRQLVCTTHPFLKERGHKHAFLERGPLLIASALTAFCLPWKHLLLYKSHVDACISALPKAGSYADMVCWCCHLLTCWSSTGGCRKTEFRAGKRVWKCLSCTQQPKVFACCENFWEKTDFKFQISLK